MNVIRRTKSNLGCFIIFVGLVIAGCGYTTRSLLPPQYQTLYIAPFKNKIDYTNEGRRNIYLPLLEVKVQKAVSSRFQFDGNLRLAKEDMADLKLTGELVRYDRDVLRYTDNEDVQEYRVRITVNLVLTDTSTGEVVWTENGFSGEGTYFVTGPSAGSESSAVNAAQLDLARRVVERTIENW